MNEYVIKSTLRMELASIVGGYKGWKASGFTLTQEEWEAERLKEVIPKIKSGEIKTQSIFGVYLKDVLI